MSEYAKRDHAALGAHYVRHISAMTAEALHTKSAIAGELAWRDAEIERMRRARADLAAKYDELLVALHGIGRALGIEEADRSPYSITCGVLAMANRLAEIKAQQPSMYVLRSTAGSVRPTVVTHTSLLSCEQADRVDAGEDHLDPLFARQTPADDGETHGMV